MHAFARQDDGEGFVVLGVDGEEALAHIRAILPTGSAAVLVGSNDSGPWQREEIEVILNGFRDKGRPVIPVLLPSATGNPRLPIFLKAEVGWTFGNRIRYRWTAGVGNHRD